VASYAVGINVGVAPDAQLVFAPYTSRVGFGPESIIYTLIAIANDLNGRSKNRAVINMSLSIRNTIYDRILDQVLGKLRPFFLILLRVPERQSADNIFH
jgi:hypothetical protein